MPHPQSLLITGASSGIGEALARHYAAPGVALALTGRDAERLAAAIATACAPGPSGSTTRRRSIWSSPMPASPPGWAGPARTRRRRGASSPPISTACSTPSSRCCRMTARRAGQIALASSIAAFRGLPTAPSYSASKAAVMSLGQSWRLQLAPDGIRVSVTCPGFVTTRLTARNKFPMPFVMPAERAAAIIARGLARDHGRIAFPRADGDGELADGSLALAAQRRAHPPRRRRQSRGLDQIRCS
jgi:NAD(P)-dependent dehydrogenase (short-subunit alcohol dehydrogenase family)